MGLISKNNISARPARAFCILVHFFAVLVLTTGNLGADHLTFGGGGGWFWKKVSCLRLSEEKNYMQNKFNRKLMGKKYPAHQIARKKILPDQKSPTPPPPKLNGRIFRALLRKWNVTSGNWRHRTNCCFHRRFLLALPRARFQINCACVNELTSGLRKKLNFQRFWIELKFFLHGTFHPQIQNIAKHWFFKIIFFDKVMGISVSFMSLKRTFFKIKRKPCLAGCKNKYKLSNHRLNTQIA